HTKDGKREACSVKAASITKNSNLYVHNKICVSKTIYNLEGMDNQPPHKGKLSMNLNTIYPKKERIHWILHILSSFFYVPYNYMQANVYFANINKPSPLDGPTAFLDIPNPAYLGIDIPKPAYSMWNYPVAEYNVHVDIHWSYYSTWQSKATFRKMLKGRALHYM
ncbi:hypothetical protein ACJX0J_034556, partial [Zea mays]